MAREPSGGRGIKSDETLFALIEYLQKVDGAGITEIATDMNLAKSTVHEHLTTMREHGFVVKRGQRYHLGLEFFKYGQYVRNRYEIYHVSKPIIDELAAEIGEMVWLLSHENGMGMYLYGCRGRTDININTLMGSWIHMHCNSGGKAMLAHLPDDEVETIIERRGLPARTEDTITDETALLEELEAVRDRGYALNLGEDLDGIHAIGVPLLFEGTVRGALSIAGPAHRVTVERCRDELAERLAAATNDIELSLAYK